MGAQEDESGSIRTSVQRSDSSEAVATGEFFGGAGITRSGDKRGDVGALAGGCFSQGIWRRQPALDSGGTTTLKATTVLAMLHWLGIKPSYSRPRVSDDNAFAEALFRTAKYRPEFPLKGFAGLDAAQQWAVRFVQWYNHEHRHSGIRYVTPAQRHAGQDGRVLAARHAVYQDARKRNPQRWSGRTRNWTLVGVVTLNPERDAVVRADLTNPAFRFDRRACFPVPTWQRPSHGAQRRRWEEQSHPEPRTARPVAREHGEAGEHRTFSAVNTVAHSSPVRGSQLRTSTPQAPRLRR